MGADLKKGAPKGATVLVGAFSIEDAYCNQGACGQRSEAAAYLLDFLLIQVTSALTNQYSVLVVHACSPFVIGSVERAQAVKRVLATSGKDAAYDRLTAFVEISVNCAGCGHAAFGRRSEPAAYLFDFLFGQVTSAPAHQYSVLVIHGYSPFIFGSVARAQTLQKEVFTAERLYIGAAFAVESISIRAGVSRSWGGAKGCGTYSSTDVLDFLLAQGTSASAEQYSIQVIHLLSPFVILGLSMAHAFAKELRLRRAQPKCLTAELANVLISIRRRRAGAEGESSKSSIDDFRFCRRQFARSPANQHSVLVIHIFVLSSFGSVGAGPKLCKEKSSGALRPAKKQVAAEASRHEN